jgi:DNA polymerase alpha subunit B
MEDVTTELTERFERYCDTKDHEVPAEVLAELQSMLQLYSITPEELDFKWQAYYLKMGGEDNKMDAKTARDFKKTMQDTLERESRGKAQQRNEVKRGQPTPRAKGGDVYDMYAAKSMIYEMPILTMIGLRDSFQTHLAPLA